MFEQSISFNCIQQYHELGHGTYGTVYKGKCLDTNKCYAIKEFDMSKENDGIPPTTLREISALLELNHPNIVRLYNVDYIQNHRIRLLFEYMDFDLSTYMKRHTLAKINARKLMHQLLSGLAYCHERRIMHRDLKPQNILVNKNGELKIADFGLARAFSIPMPHYTHNVMTLWYRAPEILIGGERDSYFTPIDVWSAGCIFVEMITNKPLFAKNNEIQLINYIFEICGTPNENTWPGVSKLRDYDRFPTYIAKGITTVIPNSSPETKHLVEKMLTLDPAKRITARSALDHEYFLVV